MSNQAFELAILLSLKDAASAGADRVSDRLRAMGKEGRVALKTFDDLRADMRRGLVLGGVGFAGLQMLRGGIKSAGDFEAAMGDLRMSLQELGTDGRVNVAKLNDEMARSEHLALQLGNSLPGTTQDMISMLTTLKQGGVDIKTILGGAGEAVANLAVVTGNVPMQLAEPFSQYVNQFQLSAKETTELANTLARLRFATGLTPQELIEGSKFFQTRAGMPLGLTGLSGAEQSGRLLATLRSYGLEGGIGGRELGSVIVGLTFNSKEQQKKLAELKSKHGISLDFFDSKGQWKGFENAFAQFEKLKELSTSEQFAFGEKLFGKEGMGIASIMMKAGVEGWQKINERIDKVPPLQELINQKTATYNAKLEAVEGTLENLKATTFTPLLDTLKPALDLANQFTGELQGFAKANPQIAGVGTHLIGIGSAALIGYSGVKTLTTGLSLLRIASAVRSNESAIISMIGGRGPAGAAQSALNNSLSQVFGGARVVVGNEIDKSGRVWSDKMRSTGARMGGMLLKGFGVGGAFYLLDLIMEGRAQTGEAEQRAHEAGVRLGENIREGMRQEIEGKLSAVALAELRKVRAEQEARPRVESLGIPKTATGSISDQFSPASEFNATLAATLGQKFYSRYYGGSFAELFEGSRNKGGEEWIRGKLHALFLTNADQLKQFLGEAKKEYQKVDQPEMFVQLRKLAGETYPDLIRQIDATEHPLQKLTSASDSAAQTLFNLSRINPPLFPMFNPDRQYPGGKTVDQVLKPKSKGEFNFDIIRPTHMATGGFVEREGLVHIHSGERVIPAAKVRRDANRFGGSGITVQGGIHLHVTIPAGSAAANNPNAFAEFTLNKITRAVRMQRERR